jgi:hypothetical protein
MPPEQLANWQGQSKPIIVDLDTEAGRQRSLFVHLRQQSCRRSIRQADTQLMAEPRPASAPSTRDDDRKLTAMFEARIDKPTIARKLKRTVAAIISRRGKLRRLEPQQ